MEGKRVWKINFNKQDLMWKKRVVKKIGIKMKKIVIIDKTKKIVIIDKTKKRKYLMKIIKYKKLQIAVKKKSIQKSKKIVSRT